MDHSIACNLGWSRRDIGFGMEGGGQFSPEFSRPYGTNRLILAPPNVETLGFYQPSLRDNGPQTPGDSCGTGRRILTLPNVETLGFYQMPRGQ